MQTQGSGKVHVWEISVRHTQHKLGAASHHVTTTYTRLIDKDTVFIQDERLSYLQRDRQRNRIISHFYHLSYVTELLGNIPHAGSQI